MRARRKWLQVVPLVAVVAWGACTQRAVGQYSVLHTFGGGDQDGASPQGSLTMSGDRLYGMTLDGGSGLGSPHSNGGGVLFTIQKNGMGFTILHNFNYGTGANPGDSLTLSGSTLYGLAGGGGQQGVAFKINTDGSAYTVLHNFSLETDGGYPSGSLALSGSTLYGLASSGGSGMYGTVFRLKTDGTAFTVLHHFAGGSSDGNHPNGSLTISGPTLYGMTGWGGSHGKGTVFKIGSDGTQFTILHSFAGASDEDGIIPFGSLTLSGSTLYGMAREGGTGTGGTVFRINTDGSEYTTLHNFQRADGDGYYPEGYLTLSGSTLYGMTTYGGSGGGGVVFGVSTDGSGYTILKSFNSSWSNSADGAYPYGSLTLSGSMLYGMTSLGGSGTASANGVLFALGVSSTPWDSGYQDMGDAWRHLGWFGSYAVLSNDWIWHSTLGYLYVARSSTPSSIFFWTMDMGWLWTSNAMYPYLYRFSDNAWLWYQIGTSDPRWFLNLKSGSWEWME